jgi:hypothetical protein
MEKGRLIYIGLYGCIILKLVFKKQDWRCGIIWDRDPRTGSLNLERWKIFGIAKRISASHQMLCCVELVNF